MSNIGLNIGLKALLTAQSSLDTIGHNIANANRPGYSRQNLHVSTGPMHRMRGLLQGTGIEANMVARTVDNLLNRSMVGQTAALHRLEGRMSVLAESEVYLGGGSGSGIGALLTDYFGGMSSLSTAPGDSVLRSVAVQGAVQLAGSFNQMSSNLEALRRDTTERLASRVDQVNSLAREINELNRQIVSTEVPGVMANDLRDRREGAVRELAELVDVRSIEDERGGVRVLVGGHMLVSPTAVHEMELVSDPASGKAEVQIGGNPDAVQVGGGAIGGMLSMLESYLPGLSGELDDFVSNFILENNRVHTTGVAASGPFKTLTGSSPLQDVNGNGLRGDELLSKAGLPFDVTTGELFVNMTDELTGEISVHRVDFDASRTTVDDLLAELNAIDNLSADVDAQGRLQVFSDAGYGFDFSRRLDPNPDPIGSLGGGRASLATSMGQPFALSPGDTLDLVGPSGAFSIPFQASGFQQIGLATADEIAAVINADPGAQANGLVASSVGGQLVLQSAGSGSSESFTVAGGSALGALGWTPGTLVSGADNAVSVQATGVFTGAANDRYTFRPNMDGTIGTTPGLMIEVFDSSGGKVADLDVGAGYSAGDPLDVAQGVSISFGIGDVSATSNDLFQLDVLADSDTTDLLSALGLNVLFTGHDAATIAVRDDIQKDPFKLATSLSGLAGDGLVLLDLLELENKDIGGLGGTSFGERFSAIVGGVALDVSSTQGAMDNERFLLDSLEARRNQVSGVNVDEELVHMIEQEQAYSAATRYIQVINDLTSELMNLV